MDKSLPRLSLADLERKRIEECVEFHNGNRTQAARELGISTRTLQRKLKEYGNALPSMVVWCPEISAHRIISGNSEQFAG